MPTVQRTEIVEQQYIFYKENKEGKSGNGKSYLSDQVCKLGQLYIQRSRLQIFFGALTGYLTDLRSVSYMQYAHGAVSVYYCRTTHHQIGGIGCFFIKIRFDYGLIDHRFSGQVGLVYLQ